MAIDYQYSKNILINLIKFGRMAFVCVCTTHDGVAVDRPGQIPNFNYLLLYKPIKSLNFIRLFIYNF